MSAAFEPLLLLGPDRAGPTLVRMPGADVCAFSTRAPHKDANQDAACAVPIGEQGTVIVVADGLGGHRSVSYTHLRAHET